MQRHMLTTVDNPFNPFTQFDDWWKFDREYGHRTCELLARVYDMFDNEENNENFNPDELLYIVQKFIVQHYIPSIYILVTEESAKKIVPVDLNALA